MDFTLILIIGLGIVFVILALKIVKIALKLIAVSLIVLVLSTAVFGYFFIKDAQDIASDFSEGRTLILFTESGDIVAGLTKEDNETIVFERGQLDEFEAYYRRGEYTEIAETDKRVFFMEAEEVDEENKTGIIFSFLQKRIPALNISARVAEKVPDRATAQIIINIIDKMRSDPLYIFKAYKEKKLFVYPETFVFKTLRYLTRGKKS